jgi:hypothetical protein
VHAFEHHFVALIVQRNREADDAGGDFAPGEVFKSAPHIQRVRGSAFKPGHDERNGAFPASHLHKFAAATPTCTMRGLSTPATPTYLKILLSISRLRAFWMTTVLAPAISGQKPKPAAAFSHRN